MNNKMFIEETEETGEVLGINIGGPKKLSEVTIDINPTTGETIELSALDKIKFAAEKFGMPLNNVDPFCKKCYGRGYIGVETKSKIPIPCQCIIPKKLRESIDEQFMPQSRKYRRLAAKKNK